jgi:hypothetical protein
VEHSNGDGIWLIVAVFAAFGLVGAVLQYVLWAASRRMPFVVVRRLRAHPGSTLPIRVKPARIMSTVSVTWDPSRPRGRGMCLRLAGHGHYWLDDEGQVRLDFTPDPPRAGSDATIHAITIVVGARGHR